MIKRKPFKKHFCRILQIDWKTDVIKIPWPKTNLICFKFDQRVYQCIARLYAFSPLCILSLFFPLWLLFGGASGIDHTVPGGNTWNHLVHWYIKQCASIPSVSGITVLSVTDMEHTPKPVQSRHTVDWSHYQHTDTKQNGAALLAWKGCTQIKVWHGLGEKDKIKAFELNNLAKQLIMRC